MYTRVATAAVKSLEGGGSDRHKVSGDPYPRVAAMQERGGKLSRVWRREVPEIMDRDAQDSIVILKVASDMRIDRTTGGRDQILPFPVSDEAHPRVSYTCSMGSTLLNSMSVHPMPLLWYSEVAQAASEASRIASFASFCFYQGSSHFAKYAMAIVSMTSKASVA